MGGEGISTNEGVRVVVLDEGEWGRGLGGWGQWGAGPEGHGMGLKAMAFREPVQKAVCSDWLGSWGYFWGCRCRLVGGGSPRMRA